MFTQRLLVGSLPHSEDVYGFFSPLRPLSAYPKIPLLTWSDREYQVISLPFGISIHHVRTHTGASTDDNVQHMLVPLESTSIINQIVITPSDNLKNNWKTLSNVNVHLFTDGTSRCVQFESKW